MRDTFHAMIENHKQALELFEQSGMAVIEEAVSLLRDCLELGGCVYLCGNGGSAADCQHIAGEFVGRFKRNRRALPAVAFTTDSSVLTCIGNDYGYEEIFTRQADAMISENDVLWAFSTSGTSSNILAATEKAREKGAHIIAFTGKSESPLEHLADCCLCSHTEATGTAQEIHQVAYHIICELLDQEFT